MQKLINLKVVKSFIHLKNELFENSCNICSELIRSFKSSAFCRIVRRVMKIKKITLLGSMNLKMFGGFDGRVFSIHLLISCFLVHAKNSGMFLRMQRINLKFVE